jgi:DNA-binding HxlR family transcriptional regulator
MPEQQEERRRSGGDLWMAERAVVLQLLRDDHEELWARTELVEEIADFEQALLEEALADLEGDGVLDREGASVRASRAAWRLDELELISI